MNRPNRKIFVTGVSGFIGSTLVNKFIDAGYEVTALIRETSITSFLPVNQLILQKGDIRDYESLKSGMRGCDTVVHAAALVSDWAPAKDFYDTNVTGTKNVTKAAKANNIKRVILISTIGVLGEEDCRISKKEEVPYQPRMPYFMSGFFESDMNHYRYSKMLAEREAIEFSRENSLNLTVLRPAWVYGPGELHAGPFEFCKAVLSGCRFLPMGRQNKFHVVYVKDLAEAVVLALEKDLAGINIFNIGNPSPPIMREYFNLYCKYFNIKPPIYMPFGVMYSAGVILELVAKLFRSNHPFLLTRARVKMFYCNNIYDVSRAKELLGFEARTSIEEGVKETVEWWEQNGYFQDEKAMNGLKQAYVTGVRRIFLDARIAGNVFLKYFMLLLKGKISLKQYVFFIKRVLLFSKVFGYNKAVRIGNTYKIHLYLPAFPTRAFYKALDKFLFLNGETIPTTVVFSMTKACTYKCNHCYQKRDGGEDLPIDILVKTAKDIQDIGVSLFDVEGGEPLLKFERLVELIRNLDDRSEIWINTTGYALTCEKAASLKRAGLFGVMVSIHHWLPEEHDAFVGKRGAFEIACSAIKVFQKVGIATVINCCPSFEMVRGGGIEKIMDLGRELKCSFVQIIHEKPSGGWLHRENTPMDKGYVDDVCEKHVTYNTNWKFRTYPSLSAQVFESSPIAFGCTAGGIERFYVNAHGEVQPCEFLNVSFGNVQDEEFIDIYKKMRSGFKKPGLKWLCNTERSSIEKYIKEKNIASFPIEKQIAAQLMKGWDKGEDVPLYSRMRLCEKV